MAHMWFGDLVTMKWWNDLWLKESFADFSAGRAMLAIAPNFTESFVDPEQCFLHHLSEAINEDIRMTTHPVQQEVRDTNDAVNVFDKICYRKGACYVNQIGYYVGDDVLKAAMKEYFVRYSMKNTVFSDFIDCFQQAAKAKSVDIDLEKWIGSWLQTAGINTLSPIVEEKEGCFFVSIRQDPSEYGDTDVLREQLIDGASYKLVEIE